MADEESITDLMGNIKNLSDDILRAENPAERAVKGDHLCPKCKGRPTHNGPYCRECELEVKQARKYNTAPPDGTYQFTRGGKTTTFLDQHKD